MDVSTLLVLLWFGFGVRWGQKLVQHRTSLSAHVWGLWGPPPLGSMALQGSLVWVMYSPCCLLRAYPPGPLELAGHPPDRRSSGEVLRSAFTCGSYSRRDLSQFPSGLLEAPLAKSEVKETSPRNTAKARFKGIFSRTFQSGALHTFPYVSSWGLSHCGGLLLAFCVDHGALCSETCKYFPLLFSSLLGGGGGSQPNLKKSNCPLKWGCCWELHSASNMIFGEKRKKNNELFWLVPGS